MTSRTARGFALLTAGVAALAFLQVSVLARAKALLTADTSIRAKSLDVGTLAGAVWDVTSSFDLFAVGILIGIGLVAVIAEIRTQAVRKWFVDATETRRGAIVMLLLLGFAAQRWLLDPGPLLHHDAHAHAGLAGLVAENFEAGRLPSWSFRWYGGFPLLSTFGSGFHMAAGAATNLLGSAEWGMKSVLLLIGLGTPLAVARLTRTLGADRGAAVIAGVACVLSFQHTHTIAWTGKFPEATLYLLFPMALSAALEIARGEQRWVLPGISFGVWCGLMGFVHLGLGPMGAVLAGVLALATAWKRGGPKGVLKTVPPMALAVVITAVFVAPALQGLLREQDWLLLGRSGLHSGGMTRFGLPGWNVIHDHLAWNFRWTSDVPAYLGWTLLIGGVGGSLVALRRGTWQGVPLLLGLLLCIPLIGGGYLPSRFSLHFVVLLAAGLGVGLATLGKDSEKRPLLLLVALLALSVDLAPTTFQAPGQPEHAAWRAHLEQLAEAADGGRYVRFVRRGETVGIHDTDNPLDVPLDAPLGSLHYMGPNAWVAFTLAIVNEARHELAGGEGLSARSLRALALQGVTVVAEDARSEFGPPQHVWKEGVGPAPTPGEPFVRLPAGSTVTFGDTVVAADPLLVEAIDSASFNLYAKEWKADDTACRMAMRDIVDAMGLQQSEPRAAALLARDAGDAARIAGTHAGVARGRVVTTETRPEAWLCAIDMEQAGAVRLGIAWAPRIRVLVNGEPPATEPVADVTGALLVSLPAGRQDVRVEAPEDASIPAWLLVLVVAMGAGAMFIVSRRRTDGTVS